MDCLIEDENAPEGFKTSMRFARAAARIGDAANELLNKSKEYDPDTDSELIANRNYSRTIKSLRSLLHPAKIVLPKRIRFCRKKTVGSCPSIIIILLFSINYIFGESNILVRK